MRAGELLSPQTRKEFREWMAGWYLREIDDAFQNAGFHVDPDFTTPLSGQRRSLVDQYLHAIDFTDWGHVSRLLRIFETILDAAETSNTESHKKLLRCLERDGFTIEEHRIVPKGGRKTIRGVEQMATHFDAGYIHTQVARMESAIDTDPALAIGSAKELVETCCKTILRECCVPLEDSPDIPKLVKLTLKELKLTPDDVVAPKSESETAKKAAEAMKRMLQQLGGVAGSLAELRNLVGSGHGPDGRFRGPQPRHARLAVGSATTLVMFMFETHQARSKATNPSNASTEATDAT